jgi:hypothetical protein
MIQEAKQQYRGVLCIHCRQPIPLPAAGSRPTTESEGGTLGKGHEDAPRVFTLRCRVCQGEGLYSESKFIDCEGAPRTRVSRSRKASTLLKDQGTLSRAANG